VWRERRVREPIVQLALFRVRAYAVGNAISVLTSVGFFAMFFLQSLYLQGPLDYAPLAAGALLVPLGGATLLSSTVGGRLSDRWGPRVPIVVGLVLTTAALIVLSRVGAGSDYASHVLPAYVLEGLGWGLVSAPLNALVIGAATTDHSAEAAGVMATLDKLGAAVGVALAGSLLSSRGDDALASELAARGVTVSSDVLGRLSALVGRPDAGAEAAGVLGGHAAAAADAMNAAFFSGFTATMLVAACAMGAALALSAAGLWSSLLSGRGR
jgi:predicted MFS family arabinose efflux permease